MTGSERITIDEFRARYGLPEGTRWALLPSGVFGYAVWVPEGTTTPPGWTWAGNSSTGHKQIGPRPDHPAAAKAYEDMKRADVPAAELVHATSTGDMEIAATLLAAAEGMGAVEVITRTGRRVVFTPAPATRWGARHPH